MTNICFVGPNVRNIEEELSLSLVYDRFCSSELVFFIKVWGFVDPYTLHWETNVGIKMCRKQR